MKKMYLAASYGRLSREDGDNLESESIKNQRMCMRNYIDKNKNILLRSEYFDDGYTGGNFNRPAWKKLMEDIENKKINTIITKDLSRMGRDYITMGEYIEKIFPEKRIRYIAINDDIDTLYETPGLDYLQFKLIFNDFYIKDSSKKIRKIIKEKKERGEYTGWKGIYGYKRDPNNKHKLIVDEEVREIVIRMFDLAKKGYGPKKIAELFSLEKIPSPSLYANLGRTNKTKTSALWCERTVRELLENPTYIGHLTQGRRKKVSYKSKKEIRVPKEDWIIVKNTHEAIIDEETFTTVQGLLKKNKHNPQNKKSYLLRGFLYCKECGHRIGINTSQDKKRRYCACCYYTSHSKLGVCSPHSLNYDKLEKIILEELQKLQKKYIDCKALTKKIEKLEKIEERNPKRDQRKKIELKINQIQNYLDQSYLDKLDGNLDQEQYSRLYKKLKEELEILTRKKQEVEQQLQNQSPKSNPLEKLRKEVSLKNPSRKLLVNLIDKIEISEDKTIEIHYKFKTN